MQKFVQKWIAVLLCGAMLLAGGAVSGLSVSADEQTDQFSVGETSRTESSYGKPGLAFRFAVRLPGLALANGRRPVFSGVRIATPEDGACAVVRVGVVMSHLTQLEQNPEQLTLDLASAKRVDAPMTFVDKMDDQMVYYTARIRNIEPRQHNAVVYARPYVVYRTAQGTVRTLYGPVCSDNASGLRRTYGVAMDNPGWVSGSVSTSTAGVVNDTASIRSRFINHPRLLVRLPQGYKATAFIHGLSTFTTMEIDSDWTVLEAKGLSQTATGVRLTVRRTDGGAITDPAAVGREIGVYAATADGVLPLAFSSNLGMTYDQAKSGTVKDHYLTDLLPLRDAVLTTHGDARYKLFFYDKDKAFLFSDNLVKEAPTRLSGEGMGDAAYFRIQALRTDTEKWGNTPLECTANIRAYLPGSQGYKDACREVGSKVQSLYRDEPANQGVQNALWNMEQLTQIVYTTLAVLPQSRGDYPAGDTHQGLPYSSTRIEGTYVPNNVSFHTFMTALQNPNSYLYTVDLGRDYGNVNGDTVYGSVCSIACTYALGIVANYTTSQWTQVPGMITLEPGVQSLQLCDTIVGNGHVVMITDVVRDGEGKVLQCIVSEAAGQEVKSRYHTDRDILKRFPVESYAYCRYSNLAEVQHTPSEYVAVGDQEAQTVTYNTAIIPRRGDKANWYYGTDVVLDVLNKGDHTAVEVYKNEAHFNTIMLDKSNATKTGHEIVQKQLPPGSYKARLTNGTTTSDWCYWIVTDVAFTATPQEDGTLKVIYSATNAQPLFVQWTSIKANGAFYTTELTAEQIAAGEAILTPPSQSFRVRVAFRTEYGIVYTEIQDGITMPTVPQK